MHQVSFQNRISFTGHCGFDYCKDGKEKKILTTETAFGREYETLDFAVKHVNKHFPGIKKRIVVGACSTGEELWTFKMLTGNTPVEIIGFDISTKSLKTAKEGVYEFLNPNSKIVKFYSDYSGYKDIYLAYDKPKKSVKELTLYKLFHNMFEQLENRKFLWRKKAKKIYKLKNAQKDCKFIKADIQNLPAEITDTKNHIFSFRNSFYHILTYHYEGDGTSKPPLEVKPLIENIVKSINKSLYKGGLFLMGKNENYQTKNIKYVTRTLSKNGFKPLIHNEKFCYIWMKIKNIK